MTEALHLDVQLCQGNHMLAAQVVVPLAGITALEGPNGSGKTSLLRLIAGLERRATGMIRFGPDIWQSAQEFLPPQKRRIGYVFQDTRLFQHMDVAQNLGYGHMRAAAPAQVLERVIEALDLSTLLGRRIGGLSGGEKQRVAIGRALAADPQLLLLDEPMSGLDLDRRAETLGYIARGVQASNCPAIYVSHDRTETAMLADRVLRVAGGQVSGPFAYDTHLSGELRPAKGTSRLRLCIGEHVTRLRAKGLAGDRFSIKVNEASVVLTRQDPGQSSALMCLPATIAAMTPADSGIYRIALEGAGWRIEILRHAAVVETLKLMVGQSLWMVVTEATTYPQVAVTH